MEQSFVLCRLRRLLVLALASTSDHEPRPRLQPHHKPGCHLVAWPQGESLLVGDFSVSRRFSLLRGRMFPIAQAEEPGSCLERAGPVGIIRM